MVMARYGIQNGLGDAKPQDYRIGRCIVRTLKSPEQSENGGGGGVRCALYSEYSIPIIYCKSQIKMFGEIGGAQYTSVRTTPALYGKYVKSRIGTRLNSTEQKHTTRRTRTK